VNSEYTDKQLTALLQEGDKAAFTLLFDRYQAKIYSVALALTRSETVAEELVQDVFMTCWLRRESLKAIESFSAYLFIMTRNAAYTALRKMAGQRDKLNEFADSPSFYTETQEHVDAADYAAVLRQAMEQLPEQQRKVFILIKEKGLTREQAALELGISPNTVKIHLGRAVKTVRAWCLAHIHLSAAFWLYWII
jgi:RNA polymerase sigma-70 factor (family 1)